MARHRRRSRKGGKRTCYHKVGGRYLTATQERAAKRRKRKRRR